MSDGKTVMESRREDYGDCADSFLRIAQVWSSILKTQVTSQQVALCMIGLKVMRESHAHKADNVLDIQGYAECLKVIYGESK